MKIILSVACLAAFLAPLSLNAEENVEENLKSVMLHLDKTQKESAQKIEELTAENKKLSNRNRDLGIMNKDLSSANIQLLNQIGELNTQLEALKEENQLLRNKIADVPVREVQTASLSSTPAQAPERITPASLEQQPKGKPPERFGPDLDQIQPPAPKPVVKQENKDPDAEPIPDFSLSGARRNIIFNQDVHLSDGTVLIVNINTATDRELRLIPGVTPGLAKKIMAERPYGSIWEIMKLEGVSRKRVEALAPYITTE